MLQGLLTEQTQVTTYHDREARQLLRQLDDTRDVGRYFVDGTFRMRLHSARHDRGAVVRTYQSCVAVLKRELGIEPGSKTRRTFEQLMRVEE